MNDAKKILGNPLAAWATTVIIAIASILMVTGGNNPFIGAILPTLLMIFLTVGIYYSNPNNTLPPLIGAGATIVFGFCVFPGIFKLGDWWIYGAIIIVPAIFLHVRKSSVLDPKEDKAAATQKATAKIQLKKTLDDALDAIDSNETQHFLGLTQAIDSAQDNLRAFNSTIATHESQWQEQLRIALLPFDNEISLLEDEIEARQVSFDEADLELKNLNARKFKKGEAQATIDGHEKQVEQAERIKNEASIELKTAQRALKTKRKERATEEQSQQATISALRTADQAQLQTLQNAISVAERAKTHAETIDKPGFEKKRRAAQAKYDKDIANT